MADGGAPVTKEALRDALREKFGFSAFRAPQEDVVLNVLHRRDSIVVMPTGGGKTLCYALPAVLLPGVTICVSPLLALIANQISGLTAKGICAKVLSSAVTKSERGAVLADLASDAPRCKVLYVTPEGLGGGALQGVLHTLHSKRLLEAIAIDEAHCIR